MSTITCRHYKKKIPQQLPLVRLDTKKKIKISLDDCQNSVLR